MALGARYPRYLVDRACGEALDQGIYSYSHAKRLTEKFVAQELDARARAQGELPLTQEHDLIRPADVYADLFARCAAQPTIINPETT